MSELTLIHIRNVLPVYNDSAAVRLKQPDRQSQSDCLSGTARSKDGEGFALLDPKGHMVQNLHVSKSLLNIDEFDEIRHGSIVDSGNHESHLLPVLRNSPGHSICSIRQRA